MINKNWIFEFKAGGEFWRSFLEVNSGGHPRRDRLEGSLPGQMLRGRSEVPISIFFQDPARL